MPLDLADDAEDPRSAYNNSFAILSADEHQRAQRFNFKRDRVRFAAARGLLRFLIGHYLGISPRDVQFQYGRQGKPFVGSKRTGAADLRFNVSHSGGMALFAFCWGRDVGVDIELERPVASMMEIAQRHFSASEHAALLRIPAADRTRAFFRCWTRKEAFIKATGEGLAIALETFEIGQEPNDNACLLPVNGSAAFARWSVMDVSAKPGFASAIAFEGQGINVACWTCDSADFMQDVSA